MVNLRPLSAELSKIAKDELNEVEARIPTDLAAIRDWLSKQTHLKTRTDDQFLIAFLRGCKYSLEKTKSKLDYYYTIKTMMPELFGKKRMDAHYVALCRSGAYVCLPQPLGPNGPRIHLTNYAHFDAKIFKLMDLFRYQFMLLDWKINNDDNCVISGYIEIIDLSKFSLTLLAQSDLTLFKKMGVFADKATPTRLKGVHLINCPKEAFAVLSLAKSLMSAKLQQRFYVHKNLDALYEVIPRDYLPVEYGGTNGKIAEIQAETERELLAFNSYFIQDDEYVVDERLRTGKKLSAETLFGIEGSFRKLVID